MARLTAEYFRQQGSIGGKMMAKKGKKHMETIGAAGAVKRWGKPGTCRHCGCGENTPCNLRGVGCQWTDERRTVCSNPSCVKAEKARLSKIGRKRNL